MVGVAQLVEPRVVIPVVVGSNPIVHPKISYRQRQYCESEILKYLRNYRGCLINSSYSAKVAELVDALDLGSSGVTCESSSLSFRTIFFDTYL